VAIGTLLLLRSGRLTPGVGLTLAAAALLLGLVSGLTFPDVDQPLPLDHRSAVTHSAAPALVLMLRRWCWPLAAGLALGIGFHLAADVFPNAMVGFATVKLPFGGSIGASASYAWLAANALACMAIGGLLLRGQFADLLHRRLLVGATAVAGMLYLVRVDGGWPALGLLLVAGWLALGRPFLQTTGGSRRLGSAS
jgi:hypothetical protein